MASQRETLLANIRTRLNAIIGDATYSMGLTLESVQRYQMAWDGVERVANMLGNLPAIVIREMSETCEVEAEGQWVNTLMVDVAVFIEDDAGSGARNLAVADVKKALFAATVGTGVWDGFGVGANSPSMTISDVDTDSGLTLEAVHIQLTCTYTDLFGDPASGG
ncbi:MAG: hypothetical protein V2A73_21360 [Pseudomonadota bacterium]